MFDPTMLPKDTSSTPANADEILTAASGRDVPNATTVKPMIKEDTLNTLAILDAPSTKKSAPFTSNKNPITNNNTDNHRVI